MKNLIMNGVGKHAMLVSTLVLLGMLLLFFHNINPQLKEVEDGYRASQTINLSEETDKQQLSHFLMTNGYVANQRDADFVADTIVARLKRGLRYSNLYHLQKRDYGKVPASVAETEGVLTNKLALSYEELGQADGLPELDSLDTKYDLECDGGDGRITVRVYEERSRGKLCDKLIGAKKIYCKDVLVCLRSYYVDSVEHTDVVGYAKTDSRGRAVFCGLDRRCGYSVLPIKKGYEYGSSKGIVRGEFDKYKHVGKKYKFQFKQEEHLIQMIDDLTLKQIKNERTITIRTPQEFKVYVLLSFLLVIMAWWWLVFVMRCLKRNCDSILIAAVMFLTGLCVLEMFAIHDPFTEELRGVEMASGVLIGIVVIGILQCVDFVKFYQGQYRIGFDWPVEIMLKPIRPLLSSFKLKHRVVGSAPEGVSWLVLALLLTVLLFFFGKDVGGMKVNLALPLLPVFQPSEVVKYLILFFMAAFFTQKADFIIAYSQPNVKRFGRKMKTMGWVIGGLVLLMFIYLFLGDMGPALVIGVTFILLYSLVKSKVNLDNLSESEKKKKIFSCDFALLIYAAVSFAIFIKIGHWLGGLYVSLLFACLWFMGWVIFCKFYLRQIVESALIINVLVSIFVFGGTVIKNIDTDLGERFEQRTSMCVNTWGDLDIDPDNPSYEHGKDAKPVSNTQVANGLWAIATGGFAGQGLGNGNPNLIPAFQTDMILSSMAEQIGWLGLLLVMVAFTLLLWRIVVIGYKSGNLFAFFFCMGLTIVTAVQFFIIALGSSGIIPLTGITVPFLSYGRVSMILNLAALGVVLSLSKNTAQKPLTETQQRIRNHSVGEYNYTSGIVRFAYIILAGVTLGVWAFYGWGCFARNKTLIHPAYVLSNGGVPMIEYNPRIELLVKEMRAGNIYDRKGKLLAESDQGGKRNYPYGESLFFMIGDQRLGLDYNEKSSIGYMADIQHKSYLRGFDNLHDKREQPTVKVKLHSDKVKVQSRYLNYYKSVIVDMQLEDNHELVKYLKNGLHGRKLRKHNKSVQEGKYDLYLTLDAQLQMDMQNKIEKYVKSTSLNNNNLLRISVVVLDAENGDLLTSANYPLPDYQRLREEASHGYSDNYKDKQWHAYTERDLGLTYQTMPGSAAKVMSAMAGFQKLGTATSRKTYFIENDDIIERGRVSEPYGYDVTMKDAIVQSSNCYFINFVNDNNLYSALDNIYESAGVSVGNIAPYFFTNRFSAESESLFREKIRDNQEKALAKYATRMEEKPHKRMNEVEWAWAWGQGYKNYELQASPLNMACVASAVVNNGKMPYTQYVLPKGKYAKQLRNESATRLLSSKSADLLKEYMKAESANQQSRNNVTLPNMVGGKTGTPERNRYRTHSLVETRNDGWYMFFVEGQNGKHPLAVCVRMERGSGSPAAVRLTKEVVLKSLLANGYINQ